MIFFKNSPFQKNLVCGGPLKSRPAGFQGIVQSKLIDLGPKLGIKMIPGESS